MVEIKPDGIHINLRALFLDFENCNTLEKFLVEFNKHFPSPSFSHIPSDLIILASQERNLINKRLSRERYIYRSHGKFHLSPNRGETPIFITTSKTYLRKLEKLQEQQFKRIPSYSEYDPKYHEDYVYSDANWSPALARL